MESDLDVDDASSHDNELAAIAGGAFGGAIDNALLAQANYSHCGKLLIYGPGAVIQSEFLMYFINSLFFSSCEESVTVAIIFSAIQQ